MLRRLSIGLALAVVCGGARADTLVLANGDKLSGEVVEWAVDHVVIEHPQLGRVRLSLDQLEIDTGTPPPPGLFDTGLLRGWTRHIDFGLNGQEGNTNATNVTLGLDFGYEDEFKRWKLAGRYFFNRSDEGSNDNNGRLELRRDWLVPGLPFFFFASNRYQYDRFESWEHRTTTSIGPGYELLRLDGQELDARLGATYTREYAGPRENKAESLFALDYEWKIAKDHALVLGNDFFLEVRPDAGDIRNITRGEWRVRLVRETGLALRVGAENEYESNVEAGDEKNALRYYLALGLDF